jgi:hypothetical protein
MVLMLLQIRELGIIVSRLLLLKLPVSETPKRAWIFDTYPPKWMAPILSRLDESSSLYCYED